MFRVKHEEPNMPVIFGRSMTNLFELVLTNARLVNVCMCLFKVLPKMIDFLCRNWRSKPQKKVSKHNRHNCTGKKRQNCTMSGSCKLLIFFALSLTHDDV